MFFISLRNWLLWPCGCEGVFNVYLNPCETGDELWRGLDGYFRFYNGERLHQSLGYKTPASRYLLQKEAA